MEGPWSKGSINKSMDSTSQTLPQRPLGNTGLGVSLLGLGLVKIGRNTGVKYPQGFELPSDAEILVLLQTAQELGVTLLDTAPAYGSSEERLGKALKQLPQLRSQCVISSKVGESFDNGRSTFDFTEYAIKSSIERSLARLGVDKLDIALVHSSGDDEQILNQYQPLATLQQLQYEGLIGACGFSGKSLSGSRLALELGAEVLMVTLNESDQVAQPLLRESAERGAGVLIKKPIASGHGDPQQIRVTADNHGVSSLVVGTLNPEHLAANAALLQGL